MDSLQASYRDKDDKQTSSQGPPQPSLAADAQNDTVLGDDDDRSIKEIEPQNDITTSDRKTTQLVAVSSDSVSEDNPTTPTTTASDDTQNLAKIPQNDADFGDEDELPPIKQKKLSSLINPPQLPSSVPKTNDDNPMVPAAENNNGNALSDLSLATKTTTAKKAKKKNNNVWVTKTSRKGKKNSKVNNPYGGNAKDTVLIAPVPRFSDKGDDTSNMKICLSKVYKAEIVEWSKDRMSAGSTKGYRMVRATRGVVEGAWYFEIKVVKLGEMGHTQLGWSTEKGDLQAPVGYDGNSFGYRDIDGSKVHKALREKYGE